MNEKVFQDVFDRIQDFLPVNWKKMVFFAGYTSGSYSMKFYVQNNDNEGYVDCYNLPDTSRAELIKLFMDLDRVLSESRKALSEKNRWTIFTMTVKEDGNMKTEFDYGDHSEDLISYEQEWKKKYL
jgi:hypothetical protein